MDRLQVLARTQRALGWLRRVLHDDFSAQSTRLLQESSLGPDNVKPLAEALAAVAGLEAPGAGPAIVARLRALAKLVDSLDEGCVRTQTCSICEIP